MKSPVRIRTWVMLIVLLIGDRILKWLAVHVWFTSPVDVLPGVRLNFLLNPGVAFSLPLFGLLVTLATGCLLVALTWVFVHAWYRSNRRTTTGIAFILTGAASNLADRLLLGGVVDYLGIGSRSVLNIADMLVVAGVCMLIFFHKEKTMLES